MLNDNDAPISVLFNPNDFVAETSDQKRALSYANTIFTLFNTIVIKQNPADRVISDYFREHKKHGSRDRKVIRETLFALFRWWGWLKLINQDNKTSWLTLLAFVAKLEDHPWENIRLAWQSLANICFTENGINKEISTSTAKSLFSNLSIKAENLTFSQLVPDWFWSYFSCDDKEAISKAMCQRPPIWARVQNISTINAINELKKQNIEVTHTDIFSDAICLGSKNINLNGLSLYKDGKLELQDLASQVIGHICAPNDNETWWDSCAGAGGKSLQLSSLLQQKNATNSHIVSSDIRPHALEELQKRFTRADFKNIAIKPWQSDDLPVDKLSCDGVLVDAPCSCTGTWRRNPDMRWTEKLDQVLSMPKLQLEILSKTAQAVKEGGYLVYATCSLLDIENQQVVNQFLEDNGDFMLEPVTHPFTGKTANMLTILPYEANTDGMFVAKMKRFK